MLEQAKLLNIRIVIYDKFKWHIDPMSKDVYGSMSVGHYKDYNEISVKCIGRSESTTATLWFSRFAIKFMAGVWNLFYRSALSWKYDIIIYVDMN